MKSGSSPQQSGLLTVDQALQQAIAHHHAGRLQDAERLYRAILQSHPKHPDANHNLGVLAVGVGKPDVGLPHFKVALEANPNRGQHWLSYIDALIRTSQLDAARQVLEQGQQCGLSGEAVDAVAARLNEPSLREPSPQEMNALVTLFDRRQYPEAAALAHELTVRFPLNGFCWKVLGAVFKQMGRINDALLPMQKSGSLSPSDAVAHYNLGTTLRELGRVGEAEASYRHALEIKPDFAESHSDLGVALRELGRLDEAEASWQRAVHIRPNYAEAHSNLGNILQELGRLGEAETSYRRALKIEPDFAEAHSNLGNTLKELGRVDDAEASYRRALQIKPDYATARYNLGVILQNMGRLHEAETNYRQMLQLKPNSAEAHSNLGVILHELGRLDEAEASYVRALQIEPDFAGVHFNLGHTLLLSGRLFEGWKRYEYRWDGASPKLPRPSTPLPQWAGQAQQIGAGILIFGEQGLGDQLQFSRYLPLVADRFADRVSVIVEHPLLTLFRRSFPGIDVRESPPTDQSAWQWQCPLLSLPLAFDTSPETIPNRVPYLIPAPMRVTYWKDKIAALDLPASTRKMGIVWKPGNLTKNAALRSLTLQQLAPLLNQPGCAWFSLQKEPDQDKAPWVASGKLIDWSDAFCDFDETAALAMNLDLVISVDTAVAHLAGGLGTPTWLFNRHASEWRWMRDREDSPWYPTMRIFTQNTAGDWDEVVSRMAAMLGGSGANRANGGQSDDVRSPPLV